MNEHDLPSEEPDWLCMKCSLPLEIAQVNVGYLEFMFPVDLLRCSRCGQVFIPEEAGSGQNGRSGKDTGRKMRSLRDPAGRALPE
jgi:hypothetical protein